MARLHRLAGLCSVVGACTLIGDTGDKRYLPEGVSATGAAAGGGTVDPCGGACPGTRTDCAYPACVDGTCDIVFVKAGDPCDDDGGLHCDGAGSCVECTDSAQCNGNVCLDHACFASDCDDGSQNGFETDVDCGGGQCPRCDIGQGCVSGSDCKSNSCDTGSTCVACAFDEQCPSLTQYCAADGNCADKKPEGGPCESDNECQDGLECDDEDGECVLPKPG
jgi:hypothetical protein